MSSTQHRLRGAMVLGLSVAVLIGVGVVAVALLRAPDATGQRASTEPHYPVAGSDVRTLMVGPAGSETMSSPPGPLHASLKTGTIPAQPMMATVLTDENCAADAQGVSHCENQLRLSDGQMLTVRHNHRMMDTPCLSPGEQVLVTGS